MKYPLVLSVLVVVCLLPAWALTAEQEAKLVASDGSTNYHFGRAVAVDGNTALLGAFKDPWDPPPNTPDAGAAYVFTRVGTAWEEQTKLVASDGADAEFFGWSVALDGDTAVVGAPQLSDSGIAPGAVYVFTRTGGVWTEQAKLLASDGTHEYSLGQAVALDGDTAVVGAPNDDANGPYSGAAYVFTRSGSTWTQQAKLLASDGAEWDRFGYSVALDSDTVVIGAYLDDDNGDASGSSYVFTRTGILWTEQAKLMPSDGEEQHRFGYSVALDSDTAVIGAYGDDDNGQDSGSAYVFTRSGTLWTQEAKLLASDGDWVDFFGLGVALDGDTALISSQDNDNGQDSGSAYVFTRAGGVWTEQAKLLASDGTDLDYFALAVAIDSDTAVIGAPDDDDNGEDSGSAYVFRLYDDDVPATNVFGLAVLLLAVLGSGVYFMRRRAAS